MSKKLTPKQIQSRIDDIEGNYYKGSSQTEEWWRITGNVNPTHRRLWTFYQGLKNKREKEMKDYQSAYNILMEHFDSLPDDVKEQGESKMSYTAKILASISIFLILLFLGVISIVLGFMVIEMANTTIIENMETSDWVLVTIGTVLVFGCFVFIQLMDLIKRIL